MSTTAHFLAVRMKFDSAVNFSTGKPDHATGQDHLCSDTIKSALCSARLRFSASAEFLPFWERFSVSSAFPYLGESYFLPKPMRGFDLHATDAQGHRHRKLSASLAYLEKPLYERALSGEPIRYTTGQLAANGTLLFDAPPSKGASEFKRQVAQRVSIGMAVAEGGPRFEPEPFFLEQQFFPEDSGWYFLVQARQGSLDELRPELEAALRLLADEGFGQGKSRGMGHFTWTLQPFDLRLPADGRATHRTNLGLYCPTAEEVASKDWQQGAWTVVKRGGYIAVSDQVSALRLRKKSIHMLAEGATFPCTLPMRGKTVDLRPATAPGWNPHPVYREGRPISLPFVHAAATKP